MHQKQQYNWGAILTKAQSAKIYTHQRYSGHGPAYLVTIEYVVLIWLHKNTVFWVGNWQTSLKHEDRWIFRIGPFHSLRFHCTYNYVCEFHVNTLKLQIHHNSSNNVTKYTLAALVPTPVFYMANLAVSYMNLASTKAIRTVLHSEMQSQCLHLLLNWK